MTILPKVPSQLINLALADLKKVEAQPKRYQVNMNVWHKRAYVGAACTVCFAGAVMAGTLQVPDDDRAVPSNFPGNTAQLDALNSLRDGFIDDALELLSLDPSRFETYREVPDYEDGAVEFHEAMQKLASDLEAAGL